MPLTRRMPVGLRILDATHEHDLYYDNTLFAISAGALFLSDPLGGDLVGVYHKTDAGFANSRWDHSEFLLPNQFNIEDMAPINVKYLYSDIEYDIHEASERNVVEGLLSVGWLTQAQMRTQPYSYGRFRYLQFQFTTNGSSQQSYIAECGFTEYVDIATFTATRIELKVDGETHPRIKIAHGDSLDLQFHFLTKAQGSYDLTGCSIAFALRRYLTAPTYALGPLTAEIDADPEIGLAEVHVAAADTQVIPPGQYIAEVRLTDGSVVKRFDFSILVEGAVITT